MRGLPRIAGAWLAGVLLGLALSAQAADIQLDLPEQELKSALVQLSKRADVQLLYSADLVEGLKSSPLQGDYTVEAALDRLLEGTGLAWRQATERTLLIERKERPVTLAAVRVIGTPLGANGSRDTYATENSGSYAARGAGIGSPFPQPLKDTPRAVSVLGLPQMRDQNLVELADAFRQLPGVSVRGLPVDATEIYVRAFPLMEYQVDGGAVRSDDANGTFRGDLDIYDRLELLRGADGLGNGYTSPAGILNLVRKRPLDHPQLVAEMQTGSWKQYRAMLDASAPLGWSGRLRGRTVLSGTQKDYFYDTADQKRASAYGIVEADLWPATLLAVGAHYVDRRATPWGAGGLPPDDDLQFPRHRSFALPWERDDLRSLNLFATLEQQLGAAWNARLVFDHFRDELHSFFANGPGGLVDPENGDGLLFFPPYIDDMDRRRDFSDLKVQGRFEWFGWDHELSFDLSHADDELTTATYETDQTAFVPINIYSFDPADYAAPMRTAIVEGDRSTRWLERSCASVTLRTSPWAPLVFIGSYRWSAYQNRVKGHEGGRRDERAAPSYLGLTYAVGERWSVYASWADVYESNGSFVSVDGKQVEPTIGSNYETGLKFGAAEGKLNAALAVYRIEQKNFTRFIATDSPDPFCCFDNGSDLRRISEGLALEISGTPGGNVQLSTSYTYNRNRNRGGDGFSSSQRFSEETPRHLFRFWSTWSPRAEGWRHLSLGGGVFAQSESAWRNSVVVTPEGVNIVDRPQGGYALFDARLGWQLDPAWNLAVNVNNLFDRAYYVSRGGDEGDLNFYGKPREFVFTLRGSF